MANPIILKEFIQSTHQKNTYLLRALLPLIAASLVGVRLAEVHGRDWRRMAAVARDLYYMGVWIEIIAFPLLAGIYASTSLRKEWANKTLETLCATPLSNIQIVFGKFFVAISRVVYLGLAIVPVIGVWTIFARIPASMVVRSLLLVAVGTLNLAALSLIYGVVLPPKKRRRGAGAEFVILYFIAIALLAIFYSKYHWIILAAIPQWSLAHVSMGTAPRGISVAGFSTASIVVPLITALVCIIMAPILFRRSTRNQLGVSRKFRLREMLFGPGKEKTRSRPQLAPYANPFAWQEKGASTRILKYSVFVIYACLGIVFFAICFFYDNMDISDLHDTEFYFIIAIIGAVVIAITSCFYAVRVFAREKLNRTAQLLILTGNPPIKYYVSKLKMMIRALIVPLLSVILLFGMAVYTSSYMKFKDLLFFTGFLLLGTLAATMIGFAFGITSRDTGHGLLWIMLTAVWTWLLGAILIGLLYLIGMDDEDSIAFSIMIFSFIFGGILIVAHKKWTPGRMSFLLAATIGFFISFSMLVNSYLIQTYNQYQSMGLILFLGIPFILFWFICGLRVFDTCMRGEDGLKR